MRKRITPSISVRGPLESAQWIDLEGLAEIEVTSEDPNHTIEAALLPGSGSGWRAAENGKQTIRVTFDNPQDLYLIHVVFTEDKLTRTQEFVLRAGFDLATVRDVVRQQYNFTPVSSEVEDYNVTLEGVRVIELEIVPSLSGDGIASLAELRFR